MDDIPGNPGGSMPSFRRFGWRRVSVLGCVVVTLIVCALSVLHGSAFAHAIVRSTDPPADRVLSRSPRFVVMRFNEPVEIGFGGLRVLDSNGRRVDRGATEHAGRSSAIRVRLKSDLPRGTYTVGWRVVSADAHPIEEAFVFHVREPGARPEGLAAEILGGGTGAGSLESGLAGAARWLTFAGVLALVGIAAFPLLVWRRVSPPDAAPAFVGRWRRLATIALIATVVGTVASFPLQGSIGADVPVAQALSGDILRRVATTRFGLLAMTRLGILIALALVWRVAGDPRSPHAAARAVRWMRVPLVVGLAMTPGLAGHPSTTAPVAVNVVADAFHVVAAGVWVGGLLTLLVAALPASRLTTGDERTLALAPIVSRFSDTAVVLVGILVATGVLRSWLEVRALRALIETSYGIVLLAKVGVFLPMLALGAFNNLWVKPRLHAAPDEQSGAVVEQRLERAARGEIALGFVVVALTALLVNLPPGRLAAGVEGPFVRDVALGPNNLNLVVEPNRVGANEIHLTMTTPAGTPTQIQAVRVLFRMPDRDIGPIEGEGVHLAPGHFVVQGRQLSIAGEWRLEVIARTGRFTEERASVELIVNE